MHAEDLVDAQRGHRLRRRGAREQRRGDLVDLRVGRLRGEQHGDEQRERIAMRERDRRRGIELVEDLADLLRLLGALHRRILGVAPRGDELRQRRRCDVDVHQREDLAGGTLPSFARMTVRTWPIAQNSPSFSTMCST